MPTCLRQTTLVGLLLLNVSAVWAQPSSDFNGDGAVDLSDFFLFADAYGGDDTAYDLDGSGRVDLDDFFLFTDAFGEGASKSQGLSISRFAVTPTDQIYTTGKVNLAVIVRGASPDALFYTWSASSGEFDGTTTERSVKWIAPAVEGTYIIRTTVQSTDGGEVTDSIRVEVADPPFFTGYISPDPGLYALIPIAPVPVSGPLPEKIDLSPDFPTPGTQGRLSSCVGWATAYLKSYQEKIERGWTFSDPSHLFSPSFIYEQIHLGDCGIGGSYIWAAFDLLVRQGAATEQTYPYLPTACTLRIPSAAFVEAREFRIESYKTVNISVAEVKSHLAASSPVVIGYRVFENFTELEARVYDDSIGPELGGHASCLVGYDDDRRAFKLINSWGTNWHDGGFGWIDYDFFSEVVLTAYVAEDVIEVPNTLPVADAGPDRTGAVGQSVRLDGTGSSDADGDELTYLWSAPAAVTLSAPTSAQPTVVADTPGTYSITLSVSDGIETSSPDVSVLTVIPSNQRPIADAVVDQPGTEGDPLNFDGSGSADVDGSIASYLWDFGDGGTAAGEIANHAYVDDGLYLVTLTVTDDGGAQDTDLLLVTVANVAPTVVAGGPYLGEVDTAISITGTASDPGEQDSLSYSWDLGDGSTAVGEAITHTYTRPGTFSAVLTVSDGDGGSGTDTAEVSVTGPPNLEPIAIAGPDQTGSEGGSFAFDGSGSSDSDGTVVSYQWDFGDLVTSTGPTASHVYSDNGSYAVVLTVTDDGGVRSADTLIVMVDNVPPVADANGPYSGNQGDPVVFSGSVTDLGIGDSHSYAWEFGDGETGSGSTIQHTYTASGDYTATLIVTDNDGGVDTDSALVTISAPNIAGQQLTVDLPGGVTMDMVWIEPGTFVMGSPFNSGEGDYRYGETPHDVTISQGFYLGRFEITQGQWEAVMGTRPWSSDKAKYGAAAALVQEHPDQPAVDISWNDLQEFAERLNEGLGEALYRLPTEAEWEYACRAGTTTEWSFGDDVSQLGGYAWYAGNSTVGQDGGRQVGTRLPNPWGLYDMHGNVEEWVQDWSGSYPRPRFGAGVPAASLVDPQGPTTGSRRVTRGGAYWYPAEDVRSGYRSSHSENWSLLDQGARLLRQE